MSFCSSIGANGASSTSRVRAGAGLVAAALAFATVASVVSGPASGWLALLFAFLPDAALFVGIDPSLRKGQLAPRAVPLYNAFHRVAGPLLLGAAVATGLLSGAWLGAVLAWGTHVALDRALGYGLRSRDGFQRG